MFDVIVSFLTEFDEFGMVCKAYTFNDMCKANRCYRALLDKYSSSIKDGTVAVEFEEV